MFSDFATHSRFHHLSPFPALWLTSVCKKVQRDRWLYRIIVDGGCPFLGKFINEDVENVVEEGAKGKECYCTRVCARVHDWLDGVGCGEDG
jgi:hypothetical protein